MDGITLLVFHIIVIAAVVATTAAIAFNAGKNAGYKSISRERKLDKDKI